jgi:hypothetical protein
MFVIALKGGCVNSGCLGCPHAIAEGKNGSRIKSATYAHSIHRLRPHNSDLSNFEDGWGRLVTGAKEGAASVTMRGPQRM